MKDTLFTRRATLWAVVACAIAAAGSAVAITASKGTSGTAGLSQKAGRAGCVSATGTRGACARAPALLKPVSVVVSPDGKDVYVAADDRYRGGVAIFDRADSGRLIRKRGRVGCVSETVALRRVCRRANGVRAPRDLVISPDSRNVYVAAASGAIAVFDRDETSGTLMQKRGRAGCVSRPGRAGACVRGWALYKPQAIAVSPDGTSVYVASSEDDALAVFDRDPRSGALKQKRGSAGCFANEYSDATGCRPAPLSIGLVAPALTVSGDGKNVYVGAALQVFERHANGELTRNRGSNGDTAEYEVSSVRVSGDGKNVYAAAFHDGLLIFDRDSNDGSLTLKSGAQGCFAPRRIDGCMRATALAAPTGVSLSPDGRDLYVASGVNLGNALVSFDRDPANGALTQKPHRAGCVSQSGTNGRCVQGRGFFEANPFVNPAPTVSVSPDGRSVYLAGDTVAVFDRP